MFKIFLSLLICSLLFAQTTFDDEEILNIANRIKELEYSDSLKTEQIRVYNDLITYYDTQLKLDSLYIDHQKQIINLLKENENVYKEQHNINKSRWYENKYLYFFYGFSTLYISAKVAGTLK